MRYVGAKERFGVQARLIRAIGTLPPAVAESVGDAEIEAYVDWVCEAVHGQDRQERIDQIIGELAVRAG